jgi:hypothetical protein
VSVINFTRTERAEDILNCQGVSFEAWLARVEAAAGMDCAPSSTDWCAWEHGVAADDHALRLLGRVA